MQTTSGRLHEVKSYFDNGDTHVGYRRLLDAAIETQDMSVFQSTLDFSDWYDQFQQSAGHDHTSLNQEVESLLTKIAAAPTGETVTTTEPVVRISNLRKKYQSGSFSLTDIDLELFPTQIIGLVGENGNGKTTLLRLLYGELRPDQGTIDFRLHGLPATSGFYDIKTRLGFIPQRPEPWYGSLMENLQFTASHYGFKGRENFLWTEMVCARMGLRPFRTYSWNRISSGFKMRFELARTIIKKPQVLLLDEPLANLDVLAQQVILEDLRFLAHSERMPIGIILSSQQLYEVEKVSEQVVFLKQGKPKYQSTSSTRVNSEQQPLVFELETTASREELQEMFATAGLQNISYNGGVYLIYFDPGVSASEVISQLGASKLPVRYFRDISASSRRFFNA